MAEKVSTQQLDKGITSYVSNFYKQNMPNHLKFHDFTYLEMVMKQVGKMADAVDLKGKDRKILEAANWFRYTGMSVQYENYEAESAKIAAQYLKDQQMDQADIEQVKTLILKSTHKSRPANMMEEITQDGGFVYLGKSNFFNLSSLLKVELETIKDKKISPREWDEMVYQLLAKSRFYTSYASHKYLDRIAGHLTTQRKNLKKTKRNEIRKKTGKEFGRGIDTMYRSTYRNHINLSSIADGKANMMISINTIILSAIVTLLGTSITLTGQVSFEHFRFFLPILILLLAVLGSAIFAILSANPKVTSSDMGKKDIIKRTKSVLFFGNFIHMEQKEFVDNLTMLKNNEKILYDNMAVDIYELGHVLSTKYKMIKISYNIFMVGLILCVLSFLIVMLYSQAKYGGI